MSDLKLFAFFRPAGSPTAKTCDVEYEENWDELDGPQPKIGEIDCGLSDKFYLIRKAGLAGQFQIQVAANENPGDGDYLSAPLDPNTDHYLDVAQLSSPVAGRPYVVTRFASPVALQESYEGKRRTEPGVMREEVTETRRPQHSIVEFEVGPGGGIGSETTPLDPGLRGAPQSDEANAFSGGGLYASVLWTPPPGLGWKITEGIFLNPRLAVDCLFGTANTHVTADPNDPGNFQLCSFALYFGPRISRHLFTEAPDWDLWAGLEIPAIGFKHLTGDWASAGRSTMTPVEQWSLLYPGQRWALTAGAKGRVSEGWALGGALRFIFPESLNNGDPDNRFAFDHWALFVTLVVSPANYDIVDRTSRTVGDPSVQMPPRLEPVARAKPPEPPAPELLPNFGEVDLGHPEGWTLTRTIYGIKTAKIFLNPEQQGEIEALLRDAQAMVQKLPGRDFWQFVIRTTGHADSRGGPTVTGRGAKETADYMAGGMNGRLSMGRAHALNQKILEIASKQTGPFAQAIAKATTQAIGRGEAELMDAAKLIHPRVGCKEGTAKGNTRPHTCSDGRDFVEDLSNNRRATVTLQAIPPGAPQLPSKDAASATQLALDRQLGPKIAAAMNKLAVGRGASRTKFAETTYDAETNRLYLVIDTLDEARLKALYREFVKAGKAQQKLTRAEAQRTPVSFPVELVLRMDHPPTDFATTLQKIFYNFQTFPFAGGLQVSSQAQTARLQQVVQQGRSLDGDAEQKANAAFELKPITGIKELEGNFYVMSVPVQADGSVSKLDTLAVYKLVNMTKERLGDTGQPLLTTIVYNAAGKNAGEIRQSPARIGYAARGAGATLLKLYHGTDARLGNRIFLLFSRGDAAQGDAMKPWLDDLTKDPADTTIDERAKTVIRQLMELSQ
ncbi:MAG: hypothetical protein HY696_01555 [Deltaproteobacteria bacterium]|nr:hypothetical protein [Deltaproteobacteria bacterium]